MMHIRTSRSASRRALLLALAAGATGTLGVAISPTLAQMRGETISAGALRLDDEDVVARLARAGFSDVIHLRRRGDHFTADARAKNGLRAKVVVHGVSGEILGFKLIEDITAGHSDMPGQR